MDNYSKFILTTIAILLGSITFKLYQPVAESPKMATFKEWNDIAKLPGDQRKQAWDDLQARIPLTKVFGDVGVNGVVEVSGDVGLTSYSSVSIDGPVEVFGNIR